MPDEKRHPLLVPTPEEAARLRSEVGPHGVDSDNLPIDLTPQEREAALLPQEPQMPDPIAPASPAVSPTGTPVVSQAVVKIILPIIIAILSAVAAKQPDIFPNTDLDQTIAIALIGIIGVLSPGFRKPGTTA
jgi:hypothetical protein